MLETENDQGVEQLKRRRYDNRKMSRANPLSGTPRIYSKLLKVGIEVSQAKVAGQPPWRPEALTDVKLVPERP